MFRASSSSPRDAIESHTLSTSGPECASSATAIVVLSSRHPDQRTYKVDVQSDGTFGAVTLFAEDGGQAVAQDKNGNVYLAAEQVLVYSPDGKLLGRVDVPERPTDLVFGGAGRRTLYILTHGSLYAVQTKMTGL